MYNPYTSVQAEEFLQRENSHLGLGSSLNPSEESSAISGGTILSLQTLPASSTHAAIDDNIKRSVDMHIRRAREQVRYQPLGQDTLFTTTQREEFPSRTEMMSKPMSSGSQRHTVSGVQSGKSATSTESFFTQHTVESAENILVRLGLEKADLAELSYYPEDQITPENFPFVLRQIHIQKAKRAVAEARSQPYFESNPTTSMSEKDTSSSCGWTSVHLDETTPCKVIDYGHISKYSRGVRGDTERTSCCTPNSGEGANTLQRDTRDDASYGEPPQNPMTEVKRSVLMSSCDQDESATNLHSPYSSMWSPLDSQCSDPAKPLHTQPTKCSSTTFSRVRSVICKPLLSKEEQSDYQSSENQTSCSPVRVVLSNQPACVLLGSTDDNRVMERTPEQWSTVNQPVLGSAMRTVFLSAENSFIPTITVSVQGNPCPTVVPPAPPQLLPGPVNPTHRAPPPSTKQHPTKRRVSKSLPTPAMTHDYAATTPKVFPHTCSLCNKECTHVQVSERLACVLSSSEIFWIIFWNAKCLFFSFIC